MINMIFLFKIWFGVPETLREKMLMPHLKGRPSVSSGIFLLISAPFVKV